MGAKRPERQGRQPSSVPPREGESISLGAARGQESRREGSSPRLQLSQENKLSRGMAYRTASQLGAGQGQWYVWQAEGSSLAHSWGPHLTPPQAAGTPSTGGVERAAGCADSSAHHQIPTAGGAADTACHRLGA